jgi:VWFA-related protein
MRRLLAFLLLVVAPGVRAQETPPPQEEVLPAPHFADRIAVERVVLDLRVVDSHGRPIPNLEPADLRVTVDGVEAAVDSLRWVSGTTPYAEGLDPEAAAAAGIAPAPAGRLIVLFFQKDLDSSRLRGLVQMKALALKFLENLKPEDRIAVASFDSQLRLWTDFTDDQRRLRRIVDRSVLMENAPLEVPAGEPSLLPAYDRTAAKKAGSVEAGLAVLAAALSPLPGTKSLAFFGWGMGRLSGGLVTMLPEYEKAQQALQDARVTVFSLDVTDSDSHTLEVGLQQVAEDTGGFYARTRDFPNVAMDRLESAI